MSADDQFDRFDGNQPDYMSDAAFAHYKVVRISPMYWETRSWNPVLIGKMHYIPSVIEWLDGRGFVRGDAYLRNDWLHPVERLFLFREEDVAIEFKLRWQ